MRSLALLAVLSAGPAAAADWPQWLGPNRDGKSPETGLAKTWPGAGPRLVWAVDDPKAVGTGYGSPAVVGDRLYVLGADGPKKEAAEFCACLNVKDGSKVWRTPLHTTPGDFLDAWGGGTRSTPTVAGDFVYVLGDTGDLVCLAKADGKPVWHKNLVKDFGGGIPKWGYSESPLVDLGHVVVTPGGKGGVVALDAKTGKLVWQCKELKDGAGYSSLVPTEVGGVRQYVQQTKEHGVGVRAADGKLLWQVGGIKRATAVIPTPVVKDGYAFFTAGYRAGCECFKLEPAANKGTKATPAYTNNSVVENHHGGVIEDGGFVYGHSGSKQWVCFDYKKGPDEPEWSSGKLGKGSITYADGCFYCYAEGDGTLAKIKATPKGWEELARFTIPKTSTLRPGQGKVWAHPVIADGKLYLRDYELLFCYDIASPGA